MFRKAVCQKTWPVGDSRTLTKTGIHNSTGLCHKPIWYKFLFKWLTKYKIVSPRKCHLEWGQTEVHALWGPRWLSVKQVLSEWSAHWHQTEPENTNSDCDYMHFLWNNFFPSDQLMGITMHLKTQTQTVIKSNVYFCETSSLWVVSTLASNWAWNTNSNFDKMRIGIYFI